MHRCNFIILDVGTVLRSWQGCFSMDLLFIGIRISKKNDVVKIIAKTGLKHFRWSVSIIQTSIYISFTWIFIFKTMCLTPEIMINPKLYSPHANTSVTKYKKIRSPHRLLMLMFQRCKIIRLHRIVLFPLKQVNNGQ